MIRVTTNSTLHMYQSNLMQSSNQLYSAMEKLMTGRNFDSYASNPAGATRAFKLHSALNAVNAQAANNETVLNKFGTAYSILDEVTNELTHDLAQAPALGGLDNSHLSSLNSYAQVIRSGADAIVQVLNGKYENDFIFNGSETGEAPFAILSGPERKRSSGKWSAVDKLRRPRQADGHGRRNSVCGCGTRLPAGQKWSRDPLHRL